MSEHDSAAQRDAKRSAQLLKEVADARAYRATLLGDVNRMFDEAEAELDVALKAARRGD